MINYSNWNKINRVVKLVVALVLSISQTNKGNFFI